MKDANLPQLVCHRLREVVSEIKKVAKEAPVLGAEGAVCLIKKLWPVLQHLDSSNGALGSAAIGFNGIEAVQIPWAPLS
ncbi:hypothetical protein DJ030_06325 [bacterium endosymbiont of Escarpia laminata]|nr:MAG: hypothetical protein DJ031_17075 [bacterium endosymbiont of Escarpia laminata]RLJ20756.1 MAG: hypothetical protein DJ030_06325 [bacterium endosymbiont of Escarpia laminata]